MKFYLKLMFITPQSTIIDIFRPFIGFKEVRLVHKDAKRVSITTTKFFLKTIFKLALTFFYVLFFLKEGFNIVTFITFSFLAYEMLFDAYF